MKELGERLRRLRESVKLSQVKMSGTFGSEAVQYQSL